MPKFKRVARKADGGDLGSTPMRFPDQEPKSREEQSAGLFNRGITGLAKRLIYAMGGDPNLPSNDSSGSSLSELPTRSLPPLTSGMRASLPTTASPGRASKPQRKASASRPGDLVVQPGQGIPKGMQASMANLGLSGISSMLSGAPAVDPLAGLPSKKLPSMTSGMRVEMPEGEEQELESLEKTGGASSAAAAIPKTKAGMKKFMPESTPNGEGEESELASMMAASGKGKSGLKKFMQGYGKFIALGAMVGAGWKAGDGGKAGAGGKAGRIAAPIMAALPGLIEMMKGKKKSSGGEPPKKSEGGAIRKFKGGSMKGNSMDSMLTPKYAKGGKMGKTDKMGKAAGEMPQHKKMAMGKPTPQSTGQKFAKGGTMKCATGGGVKGYGIAKKIRPTGPMN